MQADTLLFPIGPIHDRDVPPFGVMVSAPARKVETAWADDWDSAFAAAVSGLTDDQWHVPPEAECLCDAARGRGQKVGPAHVINLSRLVGDLADPVGFHGLSENLAGYGLMRAMAVFAAEAPGLPLDRTHPVYLEFQQDGRTSMLVGAIGRDKEGAHVYLVQDEDALRALIETSFGSELPTGVGFAMGRVEVAKGTGPAPASWHDGIGAATEMLFGVPFRPTIRARSTKGEAVPLDAFTLRALTLALFRASGIAQGAAVVDGEISLHDGRFPAEMSRFDF